MVSMENTFHSFLSDCLLCLYNKATDTIIIITCPYDIDPLTPQFYIVKLLVYRGIHYYLIFALKR